MKSKKAGRPKGSKNNILKGKTPKGIRTATGLRFKEFPETSNSIFHGIKRPKKLTWAENPMIFDRHLSEETQDSTPSLSHFFNKFVEDARNGLSGFNSEELKTNTVEYYKDTIKFFIDDFSLEISYKKIK